ncbi:MAG: radical SAM protein, partial [Candidatus Kariarchaeaceae archaeon]
VAFTGGDILCKPDFYIDVAQKIKAMHDDLWVLLETNGYGLTPQNLEKYSSGGIDSFWLDIKAYSSDIYKKLCGTSNTHILDSVSRIIDLDFTLEVLTLHIPGLVETEEHQKIAKLIADVDPNISTTLLAFFPCYKLESPSYRAPMKEEIVESFLSMENEGLKNLRIGNMGVFMKTEEDYQYLQENLGKVF